MCAERSRGGERTGRRGRGRDGRDGTGRDWTGRDGMGGALPSARAARRVRSTLARYDRLDESNRVEASRCRRRVGVAVASAAPSVEVSCGPRRARNARRGSAPHPHPLSIPPSRSLVKAARFLLRAPLAARRGARPSPLRHYRARGTTSLRLASKMGTNKWTRKTEGNYVAGGRLPLQLRRASIYNLLGGGRARARRGPTNFRNARRCSSGLQRQQQAARAVAV